MEKKTAICGFFLSNFTRISFAEIVNIYFYFMIARLILFLTFGVGLISK